MPDVDKSQTIEAVIFDLDGVIIDSEQTWDGARRRFTEENGGVWKDGATRSMMGMSSLEWTNYMHSELGVPLPPAEISDRVVDLVRELFVEELPLIDGSVATVEAIAAEWPVALASSANREVIDFVLERTGLVDVFKASVSSEEVERGKPAPDVYLEAASRLGVAPERCVAVEDSDNGILSGKAAGMRVIAVPNQALPPDPETLGVADLVIESTGLLTADAIRDVS